MEIKNKKAFTLLEVLVTMLILAFVVIGTIKAYRYMANGNKMNEIRYLALNKIDSEMNRLVFAYENFDENGFTFDGNDTAWANKWYDWFEVPYNPGNSKEMKIYTKNPLNDDYGLRIDGTWNNYMENNSVEIVDNNNHPNTIDSGDIIGLMAWRVEHNVTKHSVNLSLSITYPFLVKIEKTGGQYSQKEIVISQLNNVEPETLNLKTSTKVK